MSKLLVDCLATEWSSWSQCSGSCNEGGISSRSRRVTQEQLQQGRPCSNLHESQSCNKRRCSETASPACDHRCHTNGGCSVPNDRTKGSCLPVNFGRRCFGQIGKNPPPSDCRDCNPVLNSCKGKRQTPRRPRTIGRSGILRRHEGLGLPFAMF